MGVTLIYFIPAKVQGLNFADVLQNALFVHAFGYMVELTVTGWFIIAIHGYY